MRCFQRVLCIAILVAPVVDASASDKPPAGEQLVTMQVNGDIEIDPQGRVTAHSIETDVEPAIRDVIARAVAGWKFYPPMKDGVPAIARGKMQITLAGRPDGANYSVSVDNVRFPRSNADGPSWEATGSSNTWNREPFANGIVTASIRVSPEGRVLDFHPTQCVVLARKPEVTHRKVCADFENFLARQAKSLKIMYRPGKGRAAPTEPFTLTYATPILTAVRGLKPAPVHVPGQWRVEWRTPYERAPWVDAASPRIGASDVAASESLIDDSSSLRLQSAVADVSR